MNLFECMIPMMIYIVSIIHVSGYSRIIHVKQNISMDKNVELQITGSLHSKKTTPLIGKILEQKLIIKAIMLQNIYLG